MRAETGTRVSDTHHLPGVRSSILVTVVLLCGCTTRVSDMSRVPDTMRILYTGDLASVMAAIGQPAFSQPIFAQGTSTIIGYLEVIRLPESAGRTYYLSAEKTNRERLLYSIVEMQPFGSHAVVGMVDIRVDGTHAVIAGGNDMVLDFLSLKLRSENPRTPTSP